MDAKPITESEMKELILNNVSDLISDFLYYDRKEDEELPRGAIEEAVKNNQITVEEISAHFTDKLKKGLDY